MEQVAYCVIGSRDQKFLAKFPYQTSKTLLRMSRQRSLCLIPSYLKRWVAVRKNEKMRRREKKKEKDKKEEEKKEGRKTKIGRLTAFPHGNLNGLTLK